jgi:hypothetical protein
LPAPFLRELETARVPDDFVDAFVVDAGQFALVGERDEDAPFERAPVVPAVLRPLIGVVESELPFPVQIHPFAPDELWPGIFWARGANLPALVYRVHPLGVLII